MSLEDLTGTDKGLEDLVVTNPDGLDPKSQGDNHIRGVKNVLVNTFGLMEAASVSVPAAGEALRWDGAKYAPAADTSVSGVVQIFTANGNFQSVAGRRYKITVVGAGGSGQTGTAGFVVGSSGGGGGTAFKWWTGDGSLVAVVVGTAPGAASSFGALAAATGGETPTGTRGGYAGAGTVGDLGISGQAGGGTLQDAEAYPMATMGGSSHLGGGGYSGLSNTPSAGANGGVYGGGGGGSSPGVGPGLGAPGIVIVETVGGV